MGWETSDRRSRLPRDWPAIRARVLREADHRCEQTTGGERCEAEATDVDHIRRGDDHSRGNLRALCPRHHKRKTAYEGGAAAGAAARRRARLRYRPPEPHPGRRGHTT